VHRGVSWKPKKEYAVERRFVVLAIFTGRPRNEKCNFRKD